MTARRWFAWLPLLAAVGFAGFARAGMIEVPCDHPRVFRDADVNVVVLPPDYAPVYTDAPIQPGVQDLSLILQARVLHAIAPVGRVASVQLIRKPGVELCTPDGVFDALMGVEGGPDPLIQSGKGAIVLWSTISEEGDEIWLRSFARFERRDRDEALEWKLGREKFALRPGTQTVAFPAQLLSVADVARIRAQARNLLRLYDAPDTASASRPIRGVGRPDVTLSYFVLRLRPGWMRVQFIDTGQTGWLRSEQETDDATAGLLPEVDFVAVIAAYLQDRVQFGDGPARGEARVAFARAALERYLRSPASGSEPATAACGEQLVAIMEWLRGRGDTTAVARAADLFESAAKRSPLNSAAAGNAAIGRLRADVATKGVVLQPVDIESRLNRSVVLNPGDQKTLGNLEAFYQHASAARAGKVQPQQQLPPDKIRQGLERIELMKARAVAPARLQPAPGPGVTPAPQPAPQLTPAPQIRPSAAATTRVTDEQVLKFLNGATGKQLAGCGLDAQLTKHILTARPFASLAAATKRLDLSGAAAKDLIAKVSAGIQDN